MDWLGLRHRDRAVSAFCATMALLILGTLLPPFGGAFVSVGPDSASAQSRGELGPAPVVTDPAVLQPSSATQPRAGAAAIQTSNRQAVVNAYNAILVPALGVAPGWTGSIAGCVPGTTSAAYENATLQTVNYFRATAGLPDNITFDPTFNAKDQQSALMSIAQGQLSHNPPASFACFTAAGAEAAANSNIAIGAGGADSIDLYMEDSGAGNIVVGHRRWILYPPQAVMGTGSTSGVNGFFFGSNALWVFGTFTQRPAGPEFVAWPPPGFVPRQIAYPRWSFSYSSDSFGANAANFASAQVTMTRSGQSIPVTILQLQNGFGDNTIVWEPQGLAHPAGMQDAPYQVTVGNVIIGGTPRTFTYSVTVIDPGVAPVVTPTVITTVTPTVPTGGPIGGTGFGINISATGQVNGNWNTGTGQLGYVVLRLDAVSNTLVVLPVGSALPPGATSFSDNPLAPGGVYCYMLVPFTGAGFKQSDIVCGFRNSRTGSGAPENLSLRLNQSNTASLSWNPPIGAGQAGYNVRVIVGTAVPPAPLGPSATGVNVPITGLTCFQVDAIGRGSSDILCAIPGAATL